MTREEQQQELIKKARESFSKEDLEILFARDVPHYEVKQEDLEYQLKRFTPKVHIKPIQKSVNTRIQDDN